MRRSFAPCWWDDGVSARLSGVLLLLVVVVTAVLGAGMVCLVCPPPSIGGMCGRMEAGLVRSILTWAGYSESVVVSRERERERE